jgi:hypothetical protein
MTTDIFIGVIGIVLGFVTSYVFYQIQKRRRELCWAIDSTSLIKGYSSLFEKLDIQYGGQKIENLTVSKIVLWNNGNETIDGKDIAIPPYIVPRDEINTKILDAKIIKTSTVGNKFEILIKPDDPMLVLLFDYLDPQQGAVIQVIHTGVSILPLMVDGEVKGVKEIKYRSKRLDLVSQMPRLFIYFYAIMMFMLLGMYLYNSIFLGNPARADWTLWFLAFMLLLSVILVIFDIRQMRDTAKIPKGLSVFEKDDMGIKRRG